MLNRGWRIVALFACLLQPAYLAASPQAAQTGEKSSSNFRVGSAFRKFAPTEPYNWRGAKTRALLATVWYPAVASAVEKPIEIPGMSRLFVIGSAAQDATLASAPARFPMIVLSHGTGGSAMQMAWLGTALAAQKSPSSGGNDVAEQRRRADPHPDV